MKPAEPTGPQIYRAIVLRRDGSEVLLSSNGHRFSLPCVQVSPGKRIAQQVVTEISEKWKLEVYCLFSPSFLTPEGNAPSRNYAVLESVRRASEAPTGMRWMPCSLSLCQPTQSSEDNYALKVSLGELSLYANQLKAGPFGKPGWLGDLFSWSQEQLSPLGLRLSGDFQQFNASPSFSLIRLETNGPTVWFKATGEPNRHELPITVALARLFPGHLPAILAIHTGWNGWLSEEVSIATLDQFTELSVWERVAKSLAELQIASIGKDAELLGAQCKDLRLTNLVDLIDPFFGRMAEFMATQQKKTPPPLTPSELLFVANRLKEACSLFDEFDFPQTLGHIDFNPGNIVISPGRSVFIDWAEGCVTNPLITLEYLLEHVRRGRTSDAAATERVTAAYRRPWEALLPSDQIGRAMTVSPLVAVFVCAVAGKWRSPDTLRNPTRSGYLRSLTRRMYHEATKAVERRQPCVA